MARLLSTATAFPSHEIRQEDIQREMAVWLAERTPHAAKVLRIASRSGVERRFSVVPLDSLFVSSSFGDRNRIYERASLDLATRAATSALDRAGIDPRQIDLVTTVSCTGFMIPSVDAHLANALPLNERVRRLPITALGCAGGAMGLSHVADYLRGRPEECALLVAVELSSLNIQPDDMSMDHLVSCALFGDGAAAVVLAGAESEFARRQPGAPRILQRETRFLPDTIGAMGFRVEATGFHMILDAGIPEMLEAELPGAIDALLARAGLHLEDIAHFLIHPGGRRILDIAESVIDRGPEAVAQSRRLLAEFGNLSSASILALFHEFAASGAVTPGDRAVLLAFGPGFNAESILVEWPTDEFPC